MRPRSLVLLAMIAVLAVATAACSGDDAETTPTVEPTPTATATTPADPMETAQPADTDPAATAPTVAPAEPIPTEQNPTDTEAAPEEAADTGTQALLTFGSESPLAATACEQSGGGVLVTSTAGDQVLVQGGVDDAAMTYLFEGAELAAETTTIEAPADDVTRYVGTFDPNETLGTESIAAEFNVGVAPC